MSEFHVCGLQDLKVCSVLIGRLAALFYHPVPNLKFQFNYGGLYGENENIHRQYQKWKIFGSSWYWKTFHLFSSDFWRRSSHGCLFGTNMGIIMVLGCHNGRNIKALRWHKRRTGQKYFESANIFSLISCCVIIQTKVMSTKLVIEKSMIRIFPCIENSTPKYPNSQETKFEIDALNQKYPI